MIDKAQLRSLIYKVLTPAGIYSKQAEDLLMGTAAQESKLGTYLRQIKGPAKGIFQMEPATERDIWENYLSPKVKDFIEEITGHTGPGPWLEWDIAYQILMARLHYRRIPSPLPDDLEGQAKYWKHYYNTPLGKGTEAEYLRNYHRYVAA